jgi:hypothetical protein
MKDNNSQSFCRQTAKGLLFNTIATIRMTQTARQGQHNPMPCRPTPSHMYASSFSQRLASPAMQHGATPIHANIPFFPPQPPFHMCCWLFPAHGNKQPDSKQATTRISQYDTFNVLGNCDQPWQDHGAVISPKTSIGDTVEILLAWHTKD